MILKDKLASLNHDAEIKDIRIGMFHTAVLTRNCGLAASLARDALKQTPPLVASPGFIMNKTARELTDMVFSESILERLWAWPALTH
jgi:uncharacterized protein (DUF4213/DUF364 family)